MGDTNGTGNVGIDFGEEATIEELEFPEDTDKIIRLFLRGEVGGTEVHAIKLQGAGALARRRWLLKSLRGKSFKKETGITWKDWSVTEPTTFQIQQTPYDSLLFLGRNSDKQRPFIVPDIEDMAGKMAANQWHRTHQGLGFWMPDEDGLVAMYDGQNRCMALLISGTPSVPMTVALGMPKEAVLGTDEGHRRRTIDNVVIGGLVDIDQLDELPPRHLLTSTCRCIHFEATGQEVTSGELLASIIHTYYDNLKATSHIYKSRFSDSKLLRKGPVLAAFLLAHRRYPKQALEALERVAKNAMPDDNQNNPLRRIHGFLTGIKGKSKIHTKSDNNDYSDNSNIIYKILYGLKMHIQGKTTASLNAERQALRFFYDKDTDILDPEIGNVAVTGDLFGALN